MDKVGVLKEDQDTNEQTPQYEDCGNIKTEKEASQQIADKLTKKCETCCCNKRIL